MSIAFYIKWLNFSHFNKSEKTPCLTDSLKIKLSVSYTCDTLFYYEWNSADAWKIITGKQPWHYHGTSKHTAVSPDIVKVDWSSIHFLPGFATSITTSGTMSLASFVLIRLPLVGVMAVRTGSRGAPRSRRAILC